MGIFCVMRSLGEKLSTANVNNSEVLIRDGIWVGIVFIGKCDRGIDIYLWSSGIFAMKAYGSTENRIGKRNAHRDSLLSYIRG